MVAPLLCSKVALTDSVENLLEASPLCSKVALADSVEDPLEAPTLCSAVATARSLWQTQSKIPSKHHLSAPRSLWQTRSKKTRSKSGQHPICGTVRENEQNPPWARDSIFSAQLRALYSGCRSAHIHNPSASLFVSCLARDHVLLLCSKVAPGRLS